MANKTQIVKKITVYLDKEDARNFEKFKKEKRMNMDTVIVKAFIRYGIKHSDQFNF